MPLVKGKVEGRGRLGLLKSIKHEQTQSKMETFCPKRSQSSAPQCSTWCRTWNCLTGLKWLLWRVCPWVLSVMTRELYQRKLKHKFKFGPKTVLEVLLAITSPINSDCSFRPPGMPCGTFPVGGRSTATIWRRFYRKFQWCHLGREPSLIWSGWSDASYEGS